MCHHTASDGSVYPQLNDITLTSSTSEHQYSFVTSPSDRYLINICANLPQACFGIVSAVCRVKNDLEFASGTLSTMTISDGKNGPHSGVTISYAGGESCAAGGSRTTKAFIECQAGVSPAEITSVVEPTACTLEFYMKSAHACPSKGTSGLSGGSILLIIFFVTLTVYFIGGVAFNKYKREATGLDLIPNVGFWMMIPGLVKDGVLFVKGKVTGGGSYQQL